MYVNKEYDQRTRKIAVVTGSSSGIGFETSLLLAKNGFRTFATVRNPDKAKAIRNISDKGELSIRVVELDVNSDKSVDDAIDRINEESKRINVLVNNAGYSLIGRWRISRWMKLRPSLRQMCLVP